MRGSGSKVAGAHSRLLQPLNAADIVAVLMDRFLLGPRRYSGRGSFLGGLRLDVRSRWRHKVGKRTLDQLPNGCPASRHFSEAGAIGLDGIENLTFELKANGS